MTSVQVAKDFSPLIIKPPMPSDPALRAVAEDVLAQLRYSFSTVAAGERPTAPGELDKAFMGLVDTRGARTQARLREQTAALLDAPHPIRTATFGRYADLDPKEYRKLGSDRVDSRVAQLTVDPKAVRTGLDKLTNHLGRIVHESPDLAVEQEVALADEGEQGVNMEVAKKLLKGADLRLGLKYKKLRLFIRSVHCFEETDEVGSDEIQMGGNMTTPLGHTSLISNFDVSNDFDEGETVNYGWGKGFATWDLVTKADGFPYIYAAVIALSERDDGGFYKFLVELWSKVRDKVKSAVAAAVGGAVGGAIGSIGGPIGTAVGAIVGAVVGALIDWIISLFDNEDDIIAAHPIMLYLGAATKSYYDWAELTAPEGRGRSIDFHGDGGRYRVAISYKVSKE